MYESHVISVNPGTKSLGELNNPARKNFAGHILMLESQHRQATSRQTLNWHYVRRDNQRPALSVLVIRLLAAAIFMTPLFFTGFELPSVLAFAAGALVASGIGCRLASLVGVGTMLYSLYPLFATDDAGIALAFSSVALFFGVLVAFIGPGRYSPDALIFNLIHRKKA